MRFVNTLSCAKFNVLNRENLYLASCTSISLGKFFLFAHALRRSRFTRLNRSRCYHGTAHEAASVLKQGEYCRPDPSSNSDTSIVRKESELHFNDLYTMRKGEPGLLVRLWRKRTARTHEPIDSRWRFSKACPEPTTHHLPKVQGYAGLVILCIPA